MATWLVTGATGLLGTNAMLDLAAEHQVIGVARQIPNSLVGASAIPCDLADPTARAGLVARSGAEVVMHAAAMASIEACERDRESAVELNVRASEDLARQAFDAGVKFVFISTDAVFDGSAGPYAETDPTHPISVYGQTKAEAEQRVLAVNPEAVVARVNFYGWSPSGTRSLAEFFWNSLRSGKQVGGFTDVHVCATYVRDLVTALRALVHQDAQGIFHVATQEAVTKFEFGRAVAHEFEFPPDLVLPTRASEVLDVPRGADLSLRVDKLVAAIGDAPAGARVGLRSLHSDLLTGRRDELLEAWNASDRAIAGRDLSTGTHLHQGGN